MYFSIRRVLTECLKVEAFYAKDEAIVRRLCEAVATRGTLLTGAGKHIFLFTVRVCTPLSVRIPLLGLAALLWRMKRKRVTIGVDGSMFKFHPKMRDFNMRKLKPLNFSFVTLTR